ncbi:NAD(P)H-hydrate dehydratase [Phaeovulum vinaykumarii]|uniref:ADP-dependent (S)-NAD(P)H-hydrate dehydratase n=1 Tax=Phaeovulum vinaykumarii TaxID=407234 RepID=A0A1N7L6Z4_9RHOB|nr:NAD(P)H-hydrate dehydratase [Phaeovulum vinaykumarii]SIS69608.1 yjeF C-terminal region, hydroxyethylthiazole kinase-related [Phaeovulum vinaykumarii]SOB99407.1 hydroxyethylthiazole kinase-like uncharacterized protein yjeF [Phaeovulum vinaykumarii]
MIRPIALTEPVRAALSKRVDAHKFDHGHALVLGGGPGRGGAGRLAARAALRIGAGLVTLAVPPVAVAENAARLDAVMLAPVPDGYSLRGMLADPRISAVALGPGLGLPRAREMVPAALWAKRPVVLDADALSAFEEDTELLFGQLRPDCVLTPHMGEFARLFPDLAAAIRAGGDAIAGRADAVAAAAARSGAVVLLKGAQTIVATPDGDLAVNDATGAQASPWLATAGAGDVLAGMIAGLLARGFAPVDAACAGVWLHAEAGRSLGPGLIAEDLPEALPGVFRALGI